MLFSIYKDICDIEYIFSCRSRRQSKAKIRLPPWVYAPAWGDNFFTQQTQTKQFSSLPTASLDFLCSEQDKGSGFTTYPTVNPRGVAGLACVKGTKENCWNAPFSFDLASAGALSDETPALLWHCFTDAEATHSVGYIPHIQQLVWGAGGHTIGGQARAS